MKWNREKTYKATDANGYELSVWARTIDERWGYHVVSPCGEYARGGRRVTKLDAMAAAVNAAKGTHAAKRKII